jgi:hypothetical protein
VNVREGSRRLALVAGFVGLGLGIIPASDKSNDVRKDIGDRQEFESLSKYNPDSVFDLASEIRSAFPDSYKDLSDSELVQRFSNKVRELSGRGESYDASLYTKVRGPDDKLYLFPLRTTKEIAKAYFRRTPTIYYTKEGVISYIRTAEGRTLYNEAAPSKWMLYLPFGYFPLLGFFIPWGAVRTVAWVVLGFQKS